MSSQLIAQYLARRGDVCRLECWKLQWGMRKMERVRRGQGFPWGQYAQLHVVENDRVLFVYRYIQGRWNDRGHDTFIAQLLRHVHSIKIIGRAHSSSGLLQEIIAAFLRWCQLPSRTQPNVRDSQRCEFSGFCWRKLKVHGTRVWRFAAALNAQLTHVNYVTLQTLEFPRRFVRRKLRF